jgi:MFS family permease
MRHGRRLVDPAEMRTRLMAALATVLTLSILALGLVSMVAFDRSVEPELTNRTRLIGTIIRSNVQHGLDLGIPLERLEGLQRYLTDTLQKFAEVDRISITTASGITVAEVQSPTGPSVLQRIGLGDVASVGQSAFSLPILAGNRFVGTITVEVSRQFVETRLRDVFLDVLVIALVAILLALELALVVVGNSASRPLENVLHLLNEQRERNFLHRIQTKGLSGLGRISVRLNAQAEDLAERLASLPDAARARLSEALNARISDGRPPLLRLSSFNDIRLTLFLFSLATEIAAAFLPIFALSAERPAWLSPELAAAVPLIAYLVALAALSPFGGSLARRFGARRLFLVAVPSTAIALLAMAISESLVLIGFWRALVGVFYALATIACQEYAMRAGGESGSARAAGAVVAVIFGGVFCGSALGGVVASRFGYDAALAFGASIALLSGLLGLRTMSGTAGDAVDRPHARRTKAHADRRTRIRFLALLLGVAVPLNASTAILVWYLTPLMLAALGHGPADIARVVMLYYLAIVVLTPAVAQLSDARIGPAALLVVGSAGSGLSLLSLGLTEGIWGVAAAVVGLGLSHTLIRAPQYAMALSLTDGTRGLGALRLVERLGALFGLGGCAVYLPVVGAEPLLVGLGVVALTGAAVFAIVSLPGVRHRALLKKNT